MIDYEDAIFNAASSALRTEFPTIKIVGVELTSDPSQFPAVSIVQTNSKIDKRYSTFEKVDNVASEEYKVDAYSNLESQKDAKKQTKRIIAIVDGVMANFEFIRTFCQPIPSADAKTTRHVARYIKTNVVQED